VADAPKRLRELLEGGRLAELGEEAKRRREATAKIRSLLPAEEASHLVSAGTNEDGELILVVDTPAWAARMRYSVARLPGAVKIKVLPRSR
jgi:hypothetical protein